MSHRVRPNILTPRGVQRHCPVNTSGNKPLNDVKKAEHGKYNKRKSQCRIKYFHAPARERGRRIPNGTNNSKELVGEKGPKNEQKQEMNLAQMPHPSYEVCLEKLGITGFSRG